MSTITVPPPPRPTQPARAQRLFWALADAWVLAKRRLIQIPRIPDELIFATIQPIMFVLLFRYVFGGSITSTGVELRQLPDGRHLRADRRSSARRPPASAWRRTSRRA